MLVASLEKENTKYYIYVKKELNTYTYYGYSEQNNIREKLSDNDIEFFKDYILNLDNIKLEDTYKVQLTKDNKLLKKLKKGDSLFSQLLTSKYSNVPIAIYSLMLTLTITIGGLTLLEKYNNLIDEVVNIKKGIYSGKVFISKDVYAGELDSNKIKELIENSPNLNQEERECLINDAFFEFIDDYIDDSIVYPRLENIDIIDFTEEEKCDKENDGTAGFYNQRQPNILHVRDYDENDPFKTNTINNHENGHLMQGDFEYSYIVEGTVAQFITEFCDSTIESYPERQKRLKVLMEIIGREPILEYYGGNFEEIENNLNKYLTKKEVEEFKSLLRTRPNYEKISEVHKKIDELLATLYYNKYKCDIKDDEIINAIYEGLIVSRKYFNITDEKDMILDEIYDIDNISTKHFNINNDSTVIEYSPFDNIENNPYVNIINKVESKILTDEEYKTLLLTNINALDYISNIYYYNYPYKHNSDGNLIFTIIVKKRDENNFYYVEQEEVTVTFLEAIEKGYITVKRHYNPDINSIIRGRENGKIYNYITIDENYNYLYYNGEYVFGKCMEIPTINDKFGLNNEKDKKLIK